MLKSNDSHNLGTIGEFWRGRKKSQNRKALIINELKGLPGRIKNDVRCMMRTMVILRRFDPPSQHFLFIKFIYHTKHDSPSKKW